MPANSITTTNFTNLKLFKRGKVRDVYEAGNYYLIVSTDRLSAFDVIMNEGIPEKGKILNRRSRSSRARDSARLGYSLARRMSPFFAGISARVGITP